MKLTTSLLASLKVSDFKIKVMIIEWHNSGQMPTSQGGAIQFESMLFHFWTSTKLWFGLTGTLVSKRCQYSSHKYTHI